MRGRCRSSLGLAFADGPNSIAPTDKRCYVLSLSRDSIIVSHISIKMEQACIISCGSYIDRTSGKSIHPSLSARHEVPFRRTHYDVAGGDHRASVLQSFPASQVHLGEPRGLQKLQSIFGECEMIAYCLRTTWQLFGRHGIEAWVTGRNVAMETDLLSCKGKNGYRRTRDPAGNCRSIEPGLHLILNYGYQGGERIIDRGGKRGMTLHPTKLKIGRQAKMRLYTVKPCLESGDGGDPCTFGRVMRYKGKRMNRLRIER